MIRLMTEDYLNDVVKVHMKSFRDFFLSFLGERFLWLYYKGVINHNDTIKLVYLEANQVKGFVSGTMNPSGFYSSLLRHDWFRFGIASIPAIFKKPKSLFRVLRALAKPGNAPKYRGVAELSSIAVLPDVKSKGIGWALVKAFIQEVKKCSGKAIYLTTDAQNNDAVNVFYQRSGFKIKRVIKTPENRLMNEYWFTID